MLRTARLLLAMKVRASETPTSSFSMTCSVMLRAAVASSSGITSRPFRKGSSASSAWLWNLCSSSRRSRICRSQVSACAPSRRTLEPATSLASCDCTWRFLSSSSCIWPLSVVSTEASWAAFIAALRSFWKASTSLCSSRIFSSVGSSAEVSSCSCFSRPSKSSVRVRRSSSTSALFTRLLACVMATRCLVDSWFILEMRTFRSSFRGGGA
mmetsp:Transcript_55276/g.131963  ORF Transcript_55276/g.131963 Transcript_55276/m.131963 type:complete len:211 (+) Transcript_55276:2591-3223(+)